MEIPEDFKKALAADPVAQTTFERLPPSHKREHIKAILDAKKPETRARRINKAVSFIKQKAS